MSSQDGADVPGPPKLPNGEWSAEDIVTALEDTEKLESGDLHGRTLGRAIGWDAWFKAQSYIRPFNTGPI
jgi:hypothetical protein